MMSVTARNTSSSSGESGPSSSIALGAVLGETFRGSLAGCRSDTLFRTPLSWMRRHCSSSGISTSGFVCGEFDVGAVPELLLDA